MLATSMMCEARGLRTLVSRDGRALFEERLDERINLPGTRTTRRGCCDFVAATGPMFPCYTSYSRGVQAVMPPQHDVRAKALTDARVSTSHVLPSRK